MTNNVCRKWFYVWRGNKIDDCFENRVRAKKHAAWLHATCGGKAWFNFVTITLNGELIPFDDFKFKNGDSRKISRNKN